MISILAGSGGVAQANFGSFACAGNPQNCPSLANNRYHAVSFVVLGNQIPGIETATQWALDTVYDPTDLVAYRDESDPYPDVNVTDWNAGDNGAVAWVDCPSNNTGTGGSDPYRWCRGQWLHYNAYSGASSYYDSQNDRRSVACHELGHTVGLRHPNEQSGHSLGATCMRTDLFGNINLVTHDRDHVNGWY